MTTLANKVEEKTVRTTANAFAHKSNGGVDIKHSANTPAIPINVAQKSFQFRLLKAILISVIGLQRQ